MYSAGFRPHNCFLSGLGTGNTFKSYIGPSDVPGDSTSELNGHVGCGFSWRGRSTMRTDTMVYEKSEITSHFFDRLS